MQFTVHFKTPDALEYGIREALEYYEPTDEEKEEFDIDDQQEDPDLPSEQMQELLDAKMREMFKFAKQWVKYNEAIVVTFNMDTNTVEVGRLSNSGY
jgi:superfamily II DNA or RNA helicase